MQVVANDRGLFEIENLLLKYWNDPSKHKYSGGNGHILYNRTQLQQEFENALDVGEIDTAKRILDKYPEFALDESYFWGEGVLLFAAKENNREMIDLLMSYGAIVPKI